MSTLYLKVKSQWIFKNPLFNIVLTVKLIYKNNYLTDCESLYPEPNILCVTLSSLHSLRYTLLFDTLRRQPIVNFSVKRIHIL